MVTHTKKALLILQSQKGINFYAYLFLLLTFFAFSNTNIHAQTVSKGIVPITTPTGGFHIDGNLRSNLPTDGKGDWLAGTNPAQGATNTGGSVLNPDGIPKNSVTTRHLVDLFSNGDNIFSGGLKKDGNLNDYTWRFGSPNPPKCDINHFLMHTFEDNNGDTWITIAGDRQKVDGNSFISIALLQKSLTKTTNTNGKGGTFVSGAPSSTGGRTLGDVQISAEFTGGGSNPNLYLEEWRNVNGVYKWEAFVINAIPAFGSVNDAELTGLPYHVFGTNSYPINSFIEVSFNISAIYRETTTPCVGSIKTMFVMTKSSQSVTADLADFVDPIAVDLDINVGAPTASGDDYCIGETINALTVTGEAGATFKWYTALNNEGKPTGTPVVGATYTPTINNSVAGTHNFYVTQSVKGCESAHTTVTINVVAPPGTFALNNTDYCVGDANLGSVTLADSEGSTVSYSLEVRTATSPTETWALVANSTKAGTEAALIWSNLAAGVYRVKATGAAPTSCTNYSGPATIAAIALPTTFNLTNTDYCAGDPNLGKVTLAGSEGSTVSYQLEKRTATSPETWALVSNSNKTGTEAALIWSSLEAGVYRVKATGSTPTSCISYSGPATIIAVALPATFTLNKTDYCEGDVNLGSVTLADSEGSTVSYSLEKRTAVNPEAWTPEANSTKAGTEAALVWSNLAAGTYRVKATGAAPTSCTSYSGPATITENAKPAAQTLNGGTYCQGGAQTHVTLADSENGVNYQLQRRTSISPEAWTNDGSVIPGDGDAIDFGAQDPGTYRVIATNSTTSCTRTFGSAVVSEDPRASGPTLEIVNPNCENAKGTITVVSPANPASPALPTYEFRNNGGDWQTNPVFEFSGGQAYNIEVRVIGTDCISDATSCPDLGPTEEGTQAIKSTEKNTSSKAVEINARINGKAKVLAAPNPFTDKVRFTLQSEVSGQGSLEIYNTVGQKIATVYQGHVEAGRVLNKEYLVPVSQRQNLIYIFRVGEQKTTGKLLNW